jgi:putative membrane protein
LKGLILFLLATLVICISLFIGSQNDQVVTVNYLIAQSTLKLNILMAIVLLIGFIIGLLCMMISWLALRLQLSLSKQKIKKLRSE